jgi:hypothetical protein
MIAKFMAHDDSHAALGQCPGERLARGYTDLPQRSTSSSNRCAAHSAATPRAAPTAPMCGPRWTPPALAAAKVAAQGLSKPGGLRSNKSLSWFVPTRNMRGHLCPNPRKPA